MYHITSLRTYVKQSRNLIYCGLLRRFAPRNDDYNNLVTKLVRGCQIQHPATSVTFTIIVTSLLYDARGDTSFASAITD